jgi:hypothetical protein
MIKTRMKKKKLKQKNTHRIKISCPVPLFLAERQHFEE